MWTMEVVVAVHCDVFPWLVGQLGNRGNPRNTSQTDPTG